MKRTMTVMIVLALSVSVALAQGLDCKKQTVFTETFADGGNEGDWWHHFNILTDNRGKNKEYIYSGEIQTFYPRAYTQPIGGDSEFTGDYRARRVTEVGIQLATISAPQIRDFRAMSPTLVLVNDSGTPEVINDDCIVFFQSGELMPLPDPKRVPNWTSYTFEIPSDSDTLPQPNNGDPCPGGFCEVCIQTGDPVEDTQVPCWGVYKGTLCPTLDDFDLTWRNVISDVDEVRVQWMSPEWFALIQPFETAIDNPSISTCN